MGTPGPSETLNDRCRHVAMFGHELALTVRLMGGRPLCPVLRSGGDLWRPTRPFLLHHRFRHHQGKNMKQMPGTPLKGRSLRGEAGRMTQTLWCVAAVNAVRWSGSLASVCCSNLEGLGGADGISQ